MKFEHFAINVADARATALWYVENLGLAVVRSREDAPFTHFLADETGRVILEVYSNPAADVPDYASRHPLVFHIAFVAADVRSVREKLEKAGATLFAEEGTPDGSLLLMMRDPWGVPLQFCQRTKPF